MGLHFLLIIRILGTLLMAFSCSLALPFAVAILAREPVLPLLLSFALLAGFGALLWYAGRKANGALRIRDGFLITTLGWVMLCAASALVLYLSIGNGIPLVDAFFEATSGLTTTGATALIGLDDMPRSVLIYRQMLQWIGGMGLLVLAVAILPSLEVGGMQLYRSEMVGPSENRLAPRIKSQAQWLLGVYLLLTTGCLLAYLLAGMGLFDALAHSFTTVSIGGFSTHDGSIGYFNSTAIEAVAMAFMILAALNFSLHFYALKSFSPAVYLRDAECTQYLRWLLLVCGIVCGGLLWNLSQVGYGDADRVLRDGLFQAVSYATTTGFTTTSIEGWPVSLIMLLLLAAIIGACAGSMGGGIKWLRLLVVIAHTRREIMHLVHPNAIISLKVGTKPLSDRIIQSVWGFLSIYLLTGIAVSGTLMVMGQDAYTAFSATAACLTNLGPGLGEVAHNYASLDAGAKWVLGAAMLLGRLEVFTLLVLLTPAFWRR